MIGLHKEYAHQYFPRDRRLKTEMVGVVCDRCERTRVVNQNSLRMVDHDNRRLATNQAQRWMKKKTGYKPIGAFVCFR
jgi:hypothetical protein